MACVCPRFLHDLFNDLTYYVLLHGDPRFIHQHVVDGYAAQYADEKTKPIKVVFALVGLYLLEKDFTGRQVQQGWSTRPPGG